MKKLQMFIFQAQTKCARFLRNEEGASGIEYALIAAMVAAVLAVFVGDISGRVDEVMTSILDALGGAMPDA